LEGAYRPLFLTKPQVRVGEKMKQIKLRQNFYGTRSNFTQMGGFELQAPKSASMKDEGFVTRKGELSLGFKVDIPPSGEFSIPDTQYNRVKLRSMSVEKKFTEEVEEYNFKNPEKTKLVTNEVTLRPSMLILNDVDINEDLIVPKTSFTEEEMEALFQKRMNDAKKPKSKRTKKEPKGATQEVPLADKNGKAEKIPDVKVGNRFANKAEATGSISP